MLTHAVIQGVLAGMPERRVAQVMRQGNGFGEVFIYGEGAGDSAADLCHFYGMGQAGAKHIAFMIDEYLGFVFQAPEGGTMHNAVAVSLKLSAVVGRRFGDASTTGIIFSGSIRRQHGVWFHKMAISVLRCSIRKSLLFSP